VISAERFAQVAGSYWSALLPGLTQFVRASNQNALQYADRLFLNSVPSRHAVVSEMAFLLWGQHHVGVRDLDLEKTFSLASTRLGLKWDGDPYPTELQDTEAHEALLLLGNLKQFDATFDFTSMVVEPRLSGCGVVAGGTPDFVAERDGPAGTVDIIGEIKTVQRTFRSTDYRQMIAYLVLNFAANHRIADILLLVNPLNGTLVSIDVGSFFWFTRSQPADEAVAEIAYEWSGPPLSP
jgi:hypothetical protein